MHAGEAHHTDHHSNAEDKAFLKSLDSGYENSLEHWLEVYWLVEEEYAFAKDADREVPQEH